VIILIRQPSLQKINAEDKSSRDTSLYQDNNTRF